MKPKPSRTTPSRKPAASPTDKSSLRGNRGWAYHLKGNDEKAVVDLRKAIHENADDQVYLSDLAWILATSPNEKVRNGREAWKNAKRAYELFEQRGGQDGYALEDWLQAEREIRGAAQRGGARR